MVKISILYPNKPGAKFDMNYYLKTHMPMSMERLSPAPGFRSVSVERGLTGGAPNSDPPYIAMCHYEFESFEDFLAVFNAHAAILQGDIPNYTDLTPEIQINAVEIQRYASAVSKD
jgi:uncharacterized protein (TIGR02118 family)